MKVRLLSLFLVFIIPQQVKGSEVKSQEELAAVPLEATQNYSKLKPFLQLDYDVLYNSENFFGAFNLSRQRNLDLVKMLNYVSTNQDSVNQKVPYVQKSLFSRSLGSTIIDTNSITVEPAWLVYLKRVGESSCTPRTGWTHRCWSKLSGNRTDEDLFKELLTTVHSHVSPDDKQDYRSKCAELTQVKALRSQPSFLQ